MRRRYWTVPLTALALAGCGQSEPMQAEAEVAPAGALMQLTDARLIGTQPGPNRPVPQVDNPYGQAPNVLAEGRRLFVWYNCYGCHGGRAGGGMGPSLRDAAWLYGGEDQDVFDSIAEGRRHGMPAWGTKLPIEQMWKLTSYIQSLGTAREPKPPPLNPVLSREAPPRGGE